MIVQKNNPILKEAAKNIKNTGSLEIKELIKKLADAMFSEPDGIGIAAPQIGVSLRIFLVAEEALRMDKGAAGENKNNKNKNYITFINPVFKKKSVKKSKDVEGCLSVRGIYGEVLRPEKLTIEYFDESGKKHARGASSLFARVLQHEMDHLDGILFTDKAKHIKRVI